MNKELSLRSLSDDELLRRLSEILKQSRRTEADLVAHIAEVDARRAFAREAAPSMHAYCTEVLHLSEPETWLRIRVARASRKHPAILEMLRDGRIHLSGVALLAPHLTPKNHRALLRRATHKSKRQVEEIVADLAPRPDAPAVMRKLPTPRSQASAAPALLLRPDAVEGPLEAVPTDTATQSAPLRSDNLVARGPALRPDAVVDSATPAPRPAKIEPLAPARYKVQFTASKELHDKLQRLQALMRTTVPDGDLATLIDQAVTEKLERLESRRLGKTRKPRKTLAETDATPTSRHIPTPVRRAVHKRDGGQCTYLDRSGRRCKARSRLEFHHHETPFGRGGNHSPENIRLMCRTHNAVQAEQDFGKTKMARYRRRPDSEDRVSEPTDVYAANCLGPSLSSSFSPAASPGPSGPTERCFVACSTSTLLSMTEGVLAGSTVA
jgi:hypothetical protein